MAYRRLAYAALLGGAVLFQIVFRFYLSTFTLALVLLLPLLSVLLSLPSVLGCTLLLTSAAPTVVQGEDAVFQVRLRSRTRLPLPRLQARLHWSNQLTGAGGRVRWVRWEPVRTAPGAPPTLELATPHCGRLICRAERAWTCDLLGLFPLPIPTGRPAAVLILPPDMEQALPERLLGGGPGGGALLPRPSTVLWESWARIRRGPLCRVSTTRTSPTPSIWAKACSSFRSSSSTWKGSEPDS